MIKNFSGDTVTLREILHVIGREGMLVLCIFLTLPFMVPVSLPGVSAVFGLVIGLVGIGVMINRPLRLPERMLNRKFPTRTLLAVFEKGAVWIHRLERISRPSIPVVTQGRTMARINGLMLIIGALLLMAPLAVIPFSNTLPGMAILFLAVGMLLHDGRFVLIGYIALALSVLYFAFLLLGGITVLQNMVK